MTRAYPACRPSTDVDADVELDHDGTYDQFEDGAEADAVESIVSFKLLSIRSVIAFFTLFTWGGALYLNSGLGLTRALVYSLLWGAGAMVLVALLSSLATGRKPGRTTRSCLTWRPRQTRNVRVSNTPAGS